MCLALCSSACGRGRTRPPKGEDAEVVPTFVQIDLSTEEELDELDGIELARTTSECGALLELEPAARLGRLSETQIRCLNSALDEAARQTAKDRISRLLLGDAYAKGDIHRWMGVAARHLEEVERADPDLIYQFSYNIVREPMHIRDLHATVLHLLGFDHERFTVKFQGLDARLTGVDPCRVVTEILA